MISQQRVLAKRRNIDPRAALSYILLRSIFPHPHEDAMTIRRTMTLLATVLLIASCGNERKEQTPMPENKARTTVLERLAMYAPTDISVDLSALSDRDWQCITKLVDAGKLADSIFWLQSSHEAVALRDSLAALNSSEGWDFWKYVMINYGPYDRIFEGERFVGEGPARKPAGAGFYPADMTKVEFEAWIAANPAQREAFESPYTVIVRDGAGLAAVPFHAYYPQVERMAQLVEEAAEYADNPGLKRYLTLRAKALRSDDYYESDMAWMDLRDNSIDVVIGPIENYEDGLFNYKTAYECAVMVKDEQGSKELRMFTAHIDAFERALPIEDKYKRASAGSGNILEVVNIVYFGGDFHAGVKTIAASLPNDPRVTQKKGGKKQMYKNLMEAKFDKIVLPIAQRVLDSTLHGHVDRAAFTSFVTLHEVSHTLGLPYVWKQPSLTVRKALKERYSAIEECKADVLGLWNNTVLQREGLMDDEAMKRSIVTYVAGLFRSLRFGVEEAHGKANLVQLRTLLERGAVRKVGARYTIDFDAFLPALRDLASRVLMIEILGDYEQAGALLAKYGTMTPEIDAVVHALIDIPRDLNTSYTSLGK